MYRFDDLDPFEARRAKLRALLEAGINPYPARTPSFVRVVDARSKGEGLNAESGLGENVGVSGRIMSLRGQGALLFVDLKDETGKIQILFKKDLLSEEVFERLSLLDLGDFIHVAGPLFVSRRGELTVEGHEWTMLSKTLRPLPDLHAGLTDAEQRQRQRYAELIVSEETAKRFRVRSLMTTEMRNIFAEQGFIEVETPTLEEIPGGADAEPFVTHHNSLDVDFYLRISLELHLKRLIVGGYDRVYEIGRVFRNEGISPQHLQEFTMCEFYWAYADYEQMMVMIENMYARLAEKLFGSTKYTRTDGLELDFTTPWPRVSYVDLLKEHAGIDILTCSDEDILNKIKEYRLDSDLSLGRGRLLDQLYKKAVRPKLIQPQFVIDLPLEFSPLAKKKDDNPRITERFVVLIDGGEIGNAFSELNDPIDQRERFSEQEKLRLAGDVEAQRLDEDFLRAMEYGMPPTAGFGVGIDRLFMVMYGLENIRESVFFPTMRPENSGK